MSDLPPALRDRILKAAAERPSPPRRAYRLRRAGVLLVVASVLVALAFTGGEHCGAPERPLVHLVVASLGSALVALVAAVMALWPARSPLGRPPVVRLRIAALVVPLLVLVALAANVAAPVTFHGPSTNPMDHMPCVAMSATLGGLLLALFVYLERRADPLAPRATGALLGAVAGGFAALVLSIRCPQADPAHVIVAHILPVVVVTVVGMVVGARFLGVRWEARGDGSPSGPPPGGAR